jgi:N-acetylglucosaminyl-diphospho-decaprenol L-rhamnosyltransferase
MRPDGARALRPVDVSIIFVSYNTAALLDAALERIRAPLRGYDKEVIVVDNASRDGSADMVRTRHPECRLIENAANIGFGRAGTQALRAASGRHVLLVNPDTVVEPEAIEKTLAYMDAHPRCGILGVKLVSEAGDLHSSARFFPTPWNLFLQRTGLQRVFRGARMVDDMGWDHASVRRCDWVPGCYYLVRRTLIDEVGLFDPRYFLYYEEVDHCFAAKQRGWEVVFFPDATVVHIGGQSAKTYEGMDIVVRSGPELEALRIESELLYFRKNHGALAVWLNAALTALADAVIVLKRLLGRGSPMTAGAGARRVALVWRLFRRTRWGTRPTQ